MTVDDIITVLHVDDDPQFGELTKTILEGEYDTFEVRSETDPSDVAALLEDSEVDCLLSDYDMPEIDGIELLEQVRKRDQLIPVILFTGKGSEDVASDAISAGVTDYLQKRADISNFEVLANRIQNAVEQYRTQQRAQRQERTLTERNERLTALFENFPEPTLAYVYRDGEPFIIRINDAFVEVFGYEPEEAVGEHVDELLVPQDRREEARRIDERVHAGESVDELLRRQTTEGIREFRFRNVRLPEDEEIDGYAIYADVTELQTRQRDLERQNELFRKAQKIADVGGWAWYPREEDGYYSTQVYEIYGVDGDHAGSPESDLEAFYHPDDRDRLRDAFSRAVNDGEPYDIEVRVVDGEGEQKWVRTRGDPEMDGNTCIRVRGTIQDITERKETERRLRETGTRYRQILEHMSDFVLILEADGEIQYVSPSVERVLGYEHAEITGRDVFGFLHPDDRNGAAVQLAEIDESEESPPILEYRVEHADGSEFPAELRFTEIEFPDDTHGRVGVVRDVTERKERERSLERKNEQLDSFASLVAHDLRNPLNVAELQLTLARETGESEHFEQVEHAHDRMSELIEDLLELAKSGIGIRDTQEIALDDVVFDCWQMVDSGEGTLSVTDDSSMRVVADEKRLREVFENLFRNAVDHGGSAVAVEVGALTRGGGFYVADSGPGILAERRDEVFEPGYSTAEQGTGFGLAIVREIVEAHGWQIDITDSDSGGTRFEISGVTALE